MKSFGATVKAVRLKNKMSQQTFAESLGYKHKSVINKIETNQKGMSMEKLILLVKQYHVDISEFFDDPKVIEEIKNNSDKPNPNCIHPLHNMKGLTYVKPTIKNKNIIVGDFTYFSDEDFESHVTHFYEWNNDKLIIGKFCQIAKGVNFVMNGANHQMNAATTFPFYILDGWKEKNPSLKDLELRGDTIVGNDVWIGQDVTILPGVHIGDGAVIGLNSVVASDVEPYTIVAGNPARPIRKRLDDEMIQLMLQLKWWDKPVDEINKIIPIITNSDLDYVKKEIKKMIKKPVYKCAIFDLDGTLLDSLQGILEAINISFRQMGYKIQRTYEEGKTFIGAGAIEFARRAMKGAGIPVEKEKDVMNAFLVNYAKTQNEVTKAYEGVMDLLKSLQNAGYFVCIASNKPQMLLEPVVAKCFPGFKFDMALGERINKPVKPDPFIVFEIMNTLNVEPKECVYIGDSKYDQVTAHNAGIDSIIVKYGYGFYDEDWIKKATITVDTINDLKNKLLD